MATTTSTERTSRSGPDAKQSPGKTIALVGAGQSLESYDFILFGSLAPFLGPQFFGDDPVSGTLNALAIYGVGFVFRPIGAVAFGWVADRVGRRPVMLLSVGVMALSALLMGLMPTMAVIGIWAPILLVILRVIQGLAFGIEAPLNGTYNVEIGKRDKMGRYAGLIYGWVQLGILTASLVAFFTSLAIGREAMTEWGWRVPFLVGGVLGLFVFLLRRGLPETLHTVKAEPESVVIRGAEAVAAGAGSQIDDGSRGMWRTIGRNWFALLATVFVVGGVQIMNYALVTALPSLVQSRDQVDPTVAFAVTSGFGVIIMVLTPIFGRLADRWRVSRTFVVARWVLVPSIFLLLAYGGGNIGAYIAIMLIGAVVLSPSLALFTPIGASLVPANGRATGTALAYSIGVALFGGTSSFLFVWLNLLGLTWVFCLYGAVVCIISIFLYQAVVRRTGLYAGR